MTDKLPPLPDYDVMCDCGGNYYEPATVRSLIAAARAQALEDAARVCDVTPPHPFRPSIEAAHAIRAMKGTP